MDRKVSFHHKSLTSKILDGNSFDEDDPLSKSVSSKKKSKPPLERQLSVQSRSSIRCANVLTSRKGSASIRRPSTCTIASRGNWGSKWEFLLSCVGLSVGIGNVWRFPYLAYEHGGDFLLSCVGLSVGIGNVWRFPYLAYEHGGGAFLIPYFVMLLLAGKPLYFMEFAFGQFAGLGPLAIWSCLPIAKGIGYAMVTISLVICIYYNVIVCYTIIYMVSSFQSVVPWSVCPAYLDNATKCHVRNQAQNVSYPGSKLSSEIYWEKHVLNLSEGIENPGGVKWDLCLCLFISWIIVTACLLKGIKTSGKVVYFAATFPYFVLIILLITGLLQDGALKGILYFISPNWKKLLDIKVWKAAAGQMFFSLGVSMGALIMYSSYNNFRNDIFRDAMVVSVLDTITSIISGLVIFSVLGAMAHDLGPDVSIKDVVASGPGLAFMAYPEALSRLPLPQLWSILFFSMLFILGLDSEFALLENVLTSFCDDYPRLRNHKAKFCIFLGILCFLLGLPCVTKGGQYILEVMDKYGGGTAVVCIAVIENIAIAWIYGVNRFCDDIHFMLGKKPSIYWKYTWKVTSPAILASHTNFNTKVYMETSENFKFNYDVESRFVVLFGLTSVMFVLIFSLVEHETLKYGDYDFPDWADAVGWGLAALSVLHIPFWAIVTVYMQEGSSLKEKFLAALQPTDEWGPSDDFMKDYYKRHLHNNGHCPNTINNGNNTGFKSITDSNPETGLEFL